ncbi:hypothetical protein TREPR_1973 [Treponema primitia ZAS-2]|uniref:Uncharacterized protein n=1 Tax=Treponema primitia (strain ATCC BAA-887 / DSM 12427 / ZAS-2) TaxID=545694 RepID=F5YKG1_TREPZ|nr:hypothetical protein TREPR_1973 [Treponema primitia ZAS-2]
MGIFTDRGKIKSTFFLSAFSLSMLYAVIFILSYALSAGPVANLVPWDTGNFLAVWLPPSIICIIASAICVIPLFFIRDKRLVPAAFFLLFIYAALIGVFALLHYSPEQRRAAAGLFIMYLFLPVLWGNLISTLVYVFYGKRT